MNGQAAADRIVSGMARWQTRCPHAIGPQTAFPGRQVISLSGDGGFTMLMAIFSAMRNSACR